MTKHLKCLAAASAGLIALTAPALAADLKFGGMIYQNLVTYQMVNQVCNLPMAGKEHRFRFVVNGQQIRSTVWWTGDVYIGNDLQPWHCARRNPNGSSPSSSSTPHSIHSATKHERDAGRDGKLDSSHHEETTQGGGTTSGGNPKPPAVGGNF